MVSRTGEIEGLVASSDEFIAEADFGPEALEVNRRLTQIEPKNPVYWSRVGGCLKFADDLEGAGVAYVQVIKIDPDRLVARTELKQIIEWITARKEVREVYEQQGEQGLKSLVKSLKGVNGKTPLRLEGRRLLVAESGSIHQEIGLASEYGKVGEFEQALGLFRKGAASEAPGARPAAMVGAAAVLRRMDRLDRAEKLCREVLRTYKDRNHAEYALRTLGAILADQGRREDADKAFRDAERAKSGRNPTKRW